jgi:hypothetical protein
MLGALVPIALLAAVSSSEIAVTLGNDRGSCNVRGSFTAPVSGALAWQVLTDYDSLGLFVHSIESSRLEHGGDGQPLVRQVALGGPFPFRRRVRVLLALDVDPQRRIGFHDLLGRDFRSYVGQWRLRVDAGVTHVEYQLEAEPRGVVARAFCRGALRGMAEQLLTEVRVEMIRRARAEAGP